MDIDDNENVKNVTHYNFRSGKYVLEIFNTDLITSKTKKNKKQKKLAVWKTTYGKDHVLARMQTAVTYWCNYAQIYPYNP